MSEELKTPQEVAPRTLPSSTYPGQRDLVFLSLYLVSVEKACYAQGRGSVWKPLSLKGKSKKTEKKTKTEKLGVVCRKMDAA